MSGNVYNLDGGQGNDTLQLGGLDPSSLSLIKSQLQPDGSYQLHISPTISGGADNIINLSNFETVKYKSPTGWVQLSLADFIALTTPV